MAQDGSDYGGVRHVVMWSCGSGFDVSVEYKIVRTSGCRQDHVRVFGVGGDLRDPAIVAEERAALQQRFRHVSGRGGQSRERDRLSQRPQPKEPRPAKILKHAHVGHVSAYFHSTPLFVYYYFNT